jgi:hypothetical protein
MTIADRAQTGLRPALWLPIVDEFADPLVVAR